MQKGASLVEVILAGALLALLVTSLTGLLIYGRESTLIAGQRSKAAYLVEEGLEASRAIRDSSYSSLTNGDHGLTVTSGIWIFSGTTDTTDIFTRKITISDAAANRKQIVSEVTWQANSQRLNTVSASTYLTNWKSGSASPATCNEYAVSQGYSAGTCRQNAVQCTNNGETNLASGNSICITTFPGDPSHDTCCVLP